MVKIKGLIQMNKHSLVPMDQRFNMMSLDSPKLHKIISILLLLLITILIANEAWSGIYYVSPNGSDSNPGTNELPFRTIQKAANVVQAGDTVLVMPGEYNERVTLQTSGISSAYITFKSEPRRQATVLHGFDTNNKDYIRIEGFNITHNAGGWEGGGIWLWGDYIEIVDNYIYNVPGQAISPSWLSSAKHNYNKIINNKIYKCNKGFVVTGKGWLVEGNEVERLYRWDVMEGSAYGEDADYSRFFGQDHIIRNNYFHGTSSSEIGTSHVDGFQTFGSSPNTVNNVIIENNIIIGFFHQGMMMAGDEGALNNITVRNNIFNGGGTSAWLICARGISNLNVYNNLFANTAIHGVGFRMSGSTPTIGEIKNNIFYNAGSNYWAESGCTLDSRNNLLYKKGEYINPDNYPNNIVNQEPKFANPEFNDFKPQSGSPTIDVGLTLSGFDTDIVGILRPQGEGWDIGPYEYIANDSRPNPPKNLKILSY